MNVSAQRWARNHTSPSSAHHHTSVPATKNIVRKILVERSSTPSRSASSHASPVATAANTIATVVWFAALPQIATDGSMNSAGTGPSTP